MLIAGGEEEGEAVDEGARVKDSVYCCLSAGGEWAYPAL
jgi:hypothetical protein